VIPVAVVVGLASAAAWALGSHLFARLLARHREVGAPAANLFKNALSLVVFGALAIALGWPLFDAGDTAWLLVSGLLGFAVGDALYFAALPRCGVQLAALSGNLIPPVSALLGWLILAEALPVHVLVGMGVVLVGIVVVLLGRAGGNDAARAPHPIQGFALAALAALSQAFSIIAGRHVMAADELSLEVAMSANVGRLAGGVLGAFVIAIALDLVRGARGGRDRGGRRDERGAAASRSSQLRALAAPLRRDLVLPFTAAALIAATINLPMFTYAMGALPAGISSVLFATTPLWTLPIGLVLGQRYGVKAYAGTAVAFVGLVVLIDPVGWF